MLKSYLKTAVRNLIKYKSYSLINVFGLAVATTCTILLLVFILHELSFNDCHEKSDRIYRLVIEKEMAEATNNSITASALLAPALKNEFPQIEESMRFVNIDNPVPLISFENHKFFEKKIFFTDPAVFNIFTIPFVFGNEKTALVNPNSVVITETTASKYFGKDNPIGKTITLNNFLDLEITGVIKDFPSNSIIHFDFAVSFSTFFGWLGRDFVEDPQNNMFMSYVLLSEKTSSESLSALLPEFTAEYFSESTRVKNIYLQPLNRIHLYSNRDFNLSSSGDIRTVYLLGAVALFVLIIASFNYVGLTSAQFIHRSKEIGVRKLIGATKKQLVGQFIGEGLLLIVLSFLFTLLLVDISMPIFKEIIGENFNIEIQNNWQLFFLPFCFVILSGLLSVIYPAFIISSFQPAQAIRGGLKLGKNRMLFRKILVALQFSLTIVLLTGTFIVSKQLRYMQNKSIGFDKDKVVVIPVRNENLRSNLEPVKNRILENHMVLNTGAAALLPGGPVGKTSFKAEGVSQPGTMSMLWVDNDFIKTLGIQILAGRDFSDAFPSDAHESFILNEEAVKEFGWKTPEEAIGKAFEIDNSKRGKIIGVVKDFHFASFEYKVEPVVMHIWPWMNYLLVRTDSKNTAEVLNHIKNVWTEFDQANPFEYFLLRDRFERFVLPEKRLEKLAGVFTLVALSIACLGLFSLAVFAVRSKAKEIVVRKVLGASTLNILYKQLLEFATIIFIAVLSASPVAYLAMSKWLQNYEYKIEIGWWIFALTGGTALLIALITVSFQAIKAAMANPAKALRYE